ncbi:unnamed protein product [Moneuplotes crassus]|uniref:Uncharacterized protein n=1 Tax=Euplotes crassus TaxID=5936 RepID=A0AAD2D931_EUPCR|nr:unnamed protein product [Moneuplotes crassus]
MKPSYFLLFLRKLLFCVTLNVTAVSATQNSILGENFQPLKLINGFIHKMKGTGELVNTRYFPEIQEVVLGVYFTLLLTICILGIVVLVIDMMKGEYG